MESVDLLTRSTECPLLAAKMISGQLQYYQASMELHTRKQTAIN
jgi:hypothetical protein